MRTNNYSTPGTFSFATTSQSANLIHSEMAEPNASLLPGSSPLFTSAITLHRILFTLVFALVTSSLMAKPPKSKRPTTTQAQLGQQLIAHVTYPTVMAEGNYAGVVVITFSISDESRVSRLTVHTANQKLNDELTTQLLGKKIRLDGANPYDVHTVRLRFTK